MSELSNSVTKGLIGQFSSGDDIIHKCKVVPEPDRNEVERSGDERPDIGDEDKKSFESISGRMQMHGDGLQRRTWIKSSSKDS